MTTATGNYVCDNSTLANFKSWAQAISNAFSAFGWVQTSDTGQVNWTSIASVPSSTYVYEVWKANDSLAATAPIYVRINYGFSSTSPRIQVFAGTGSNGSGTINGATIDGTPWALSYNGIANNGTTTYPCYFSGNAGEFRMYMWSSAAGFNASCIFGVERSKSTAGADTADYFTVFTANNGTTTQSNQQSITPSSGAGNRDNGIIGLALSSNSASGAAFGSVAALPIFPIVGKVGNPMLGFMTAAANDVSNGSSVTVTSMYGSTHTYIGVSPGGSSMSQSLGFRGANGTSMAALMRYE